jgi:hypothetical protein
MEWFWVSLSYATFGIALRSGRVVEAAPIARWAVGKDGEFALNYFRRKGAKVHPLF